MNNFLKKNTFFLVSIGAILAAILRWQVSQIFIVNLIGCFLLGLINGLPISKKYKSIFGFGFCGSLTTFSGWSLQLFQLISKGLFTLFLLNSLLFVIISIVAVGLGDVIDKKIIN